MGLISCKNSTFESTGLSLPWLLLHKMENVFQTPAKNYVQAQKIHFFYQTPISILAASCEESCLSFPV